MEGIEKEFAEAGRRLLAAMEESGTTRDAVMKATGVGERTIQRWVGGENKVPTKKLEVIANLTGFEFLWLHMGTGQRKKRAPSEELRSLQFYEGFLSNFDYLMAMFDKQGRFIFATDAYIEGFQIENQRPVVGKRISEVFTNEDSIEYERSLLQGEPTTRLEARYYEPNGIPTWIAWRSIPWSYRDSDGVDGWIVICSIGDTKEEVEKVGDIAYKRDGEPDFIYTADVERRTLPVETPTHSVVQIGSNENKLDDNFTNQLIDIVVSIIGEEGIRMMSDSYGGQPSAPLTVINVDAVKPVAGTLCRFRVQATIETDILQAGEINAASTQKKDSPPKGEES